MNVSISSYVVPIASFRFFISPITHQNRPPKLVFFTGVNRLNVLNTKTNLEKFKRREKIVSRDWRIGSRDDVWGLLKSHGQLRRKTFSPHISPPNVSVFHIVVERVPKETSPGINFFFFFFEEQKMKWIPLFPKE